MNPDRAYIVTTSTATCCCRGQGMLPNKDIPELYSVIGKPADPLFMESNHGRGTMGSPPSYAVDVGA